MDIRSDHAVGDVAMRPKLLVWEGYSQSWGINGKKGMTDVVEGG